MTEISLVSPTILEFGPIHVTNTVLGAFVTTVICIALVFIFGSKPKMVPGRMQVLFEMMITSFLGFLRGSYADEKRVRRYLSFYITLFFFLLIANQFSILPLLSNITAGEEGNYLLRMSTADFSQPIALALIAIVGGHLIALTKSPIKHINNFLKFDKLIAIRKPADIPNYLLELFLGILDIIGEFSKVISLSARLFGNIFAGDVMVVVISSIAVFTTYVVPIPFIFLGMFSSLVQAFVFAILCLQFMAGTITAAEPAPKN
jgi:F-type H+-transporting ATPase subunit a